MAHCRQEARVQRPGSPLVHDQECGVRTLEAYSVRTREGEGAAWKESHVPPCQFGQSCVNGFC